MTSLSSTKDASPVALVPKRVQITPILGKIAVENASLAETQPGNNSTRWIFDIEGRVDTPIVIQLLDSRSGKPLHAGLIVGSFLARSPEFYAARPYIEPLDNGKLVLQHADTSIACKYRIGIDTVHSATR